VKQIAKFVEKEIVLCISFLTALVSMAFVPIDHQYIHYIDYHTLMTLLSLMIIMAGLQELSVFTRIGLWILKKTHSVMSIAIVLVLLCFIFSMVITNDVALITFVPFTIEVLILAGLEKYLIRIIVLQTIAGNLGSMLTPIGNPQNLYLFSLSNLNLGSFMTLMLPYTLLSLFGLVFACILLTGKASPMIEVRQDGRIMVTDQKKLAVCLLLLLLALTSVTHTIPGYIVLSVILVVVALMDYRILCKPDYSLLLTFIFLFVFIGNIKRIPAINAWLYSIIHGHELLTAVLASQFISNVPAAILLSGFTDHMPALIIGSNLGGLGTIIASMASLISFKYYGAINHNNNTAYLGVFTVLNLIFLALLLLLFYLIGADPGI
jgi:Na+/H+ antiporter NhaD/arsenite permease-like protein